MRGVGITQPAPVPDSPGNLLRLLEWCYTNRDVFKYRELFDDNYRFVFGALDPDGFAYRDNPWTREDEVQSTTHLFQGGDANQPAATSITIFLDRNFRVTEDPNHPGRAHKLVRTSVTLKVVTDQEREITGFANFFVVRGDSAAIPDELRQRGFLPDSNRWYILRHEDDTFQETPGASASAPSLAPRFSLATTPRAVSTEDFLFPSSWGALKRAYR
ncbi:MAG: hypothetical protein E6K80_06290 [Candidatus Eisenbacteria bacterium]|uniref:SnoaL-like domain-containing protein n=1 Tax=Eiseniibacteriota bacterium TaxID=2212470 RepID=A0A538U5R3_UNCEI|nr:MAG: hypothetical protein E6K80_06290 [Candidatus Eisenbacteria bacterium]